MKVALVGATGMTGRRALAALLARGHSVVAVGRNPERLAGLDPRAERTPTGSMKRVESRVPVNDLQDQPLLSQAKKMLEEQRSE